MVVIWVQSPRNASADRVHLSVLVWSSNLITSVTAVTCQQRVAEAYVIPDIIRVQRDIEFEVGVHI